MEATAEEYVATYLTRGGKVFIVPQYSIDKDGKGDWACPDFVALDFKKKEVVVIEVTTAFAFAGLISRVADREQRWFEPIKAKFEEDGLTEQTQWPIRFLGFVRSESLAAARKSFEGQGDVAFKALEEVAFPWTYWSDRAVNGLPR